MEPTMTEVSENCRKVATELEKLSKSLPDLGKTKSLSIVSDYYEHTLFAIVTGKDVIQSEIDFQNRCLVPSLTKEFAEKIKYIFESGSILSESAAQVNLLTDMNKKLLADLATANGSLQVKTEKLDEIEKINKKLAETNTKLNKESVSSRLVPSANAIHVIDPEKFVAALANVKTKRNQLKEVLDENPDSEQARTMMKFLDSLLEPTIGL